MSTASSDDVYGRIVHHSSDLRHPSSPENCFPRELILAHRGLWLESAAGNSRDAFMSAARFGLGIETDLRDSSAGLVIAHDPPVASQPLTFEEFLIALSGWETSPGMLALNIKSDGLLPLIGAVISELDQREYFFFDMSVPELLRYARAGLPVAVRMSEYERYDPTLGEVIGGECRIWLDSFTHDWFLARDAVGDVIESALVAVVSPEIHGRDPRWVWDWVWDQRSSGFNVSICTDRPLEFLEWGSGN